MNKTITAVAVALTLGFAINANAGLFCKNSVGQTYEWHIGESRPVNSNLMKKEDFDTGDVGIVCILNAQTYRDVAAGTIGIRGFPVQSSVNTDAVRGPDGSGTIYRGEAARWLVDNLPSSYGDPATKAYYNSIAP